MEKQYRQGDVFIRRIGAVPSQAKPVERKGDVVLAYGEVTGHAHRIVAPLDAVDVLAEAEKIILNVKEAVTVTHEEHGPVTLQPGIYESYIQKEYDDVEGWRRVAD